MHEDDNKHNIKEIECKRKGKNARENKMHEDDSKHGIKEMECEKKKETKCTRNKMHERNKSKMQRGVCKK